MIYQVVLMDKRDYINAHCDFHEEQIHVMIAYIKQQVKLNNKVQITKWSDKHERVD